MSYKIYKDTRPHNQEKADRLGLDRHLYLEELGIQFEKIGVNFCDNTDDRYEQWMEYRKLYGFDPRETWNLNDYFIGWLYEHLMAYKDLAKVIDLNFHKFEFEGETYTQAQMIDMCIEQCKKCLTNEIIDCSDDDLTRAAQIFAVILPAMWW